MYPGTHLDVRSPIVGPKYVSGAYLNPVSLQQLLVLPSPRGNFADRELNARSGLRNCNSGVVGGSSGTCALNGSDESRRLLGRGSRRRGVRNGDGSKKNVLYWVEGACSG